MKKIFDEFKTFAFKGNVVDMAIGILIGTAFGKIVTSVLNDLLMPFVSLLTGGINFSDLYIVLKGDATGCATLEAAREAGCICLGYGNLIQIVLDFFIVAVCAFLLVKAMNKLKKQPEPEAPKKEARKCPFCCSEIADEATRCPHCTSELPAPAEKTEA